MDTATARHQPVTHSRIADARRRTRAIKTVAAWAAVAAFTFTAILARTAHPGAAAHKGSTGSLAPPQRLTDQLSSSFLAAGDVGPSNASGAAAQTSTS